MEPKWLTLARSQLGVREAPGEKNNPTVQDYYKDSGAGVLVDSTPWCAAFVGSMLMHAGYPPSGSLMARSYLTWGEKTVPKPGAIAVYARGRPPSGHVAIVESVHGSTVTIIGGNQSDAVTRQVRPIRAALDYRWPMTARKAMVYRSGQGVSDMADMTPKQIMDKVSKLYGSVDSMGYSQVRPAVKQALECLFYLAKLQLPDSERKALKKGLPKPKAKRKAK